jgi:hypothetical protein
MIRGERGVIGPQDAAGDPEGEDPYVRISRNPAADSSLRNSRPL